MNIRTAQTPEDILLCWEAMHELRPRLVREEFVPLVTEMIREGYVLAYIPEEGPDRGSPGRRAAAAIGFRYLRFLLHGAHIYIDDLSTLPEHRGKGYAGALLDHVFNLAAQKGLKVVTLDSGPARHDAHRLYLNRGFSLSSYHFVRDRSIPGQGRHPSPDRGRPD
jgi:GNAT superfamily N-acetyltransferase